MKIVNNLSTDDGFLVFLYRIDDGKELESFGIHVAKMAGLNNTILQRAEYLSKKFAKYEGIDQEEEDKQFKNNENLKKQEIIDYFLKFNFTHTNVQKWKTWMDQNK